MNTDLLDAYLAQRTDRCSGCGFHVRTQGHGRDCTELAPVAPIGGTADEWAIFRAALRQAVRDDGTVHQCDVRPIIRGRIAPKHIGQMWRRARSEGLVADTGEREQSNDVAGRNADKLDRIYAWRAAA